jgi:hypothetical protein
MFLSVTLWARATDVIGTYSSNRTAGTLDVEALADTVFIGAGVTASADVKTASGAGRGRGVGCDTDNAGGALSGDAACELAAGIIQGGSSAIGGGSILCSELCDTLGGYAVISGGGVSYGLPVGSGAHASGGEDGLGARECGSRLSEMDGVVTGTHVNPVFLFLYREQVLVCGLDAVMGLQLFLAGPANNASSKHLVDLSKPICGSCGRTGGCAVMSHP